MDRDFLASDEGLLHALELLRRDHADPAAIDLPERLPDAGLGPRQALELLAPIVLGRAARLNDPAAFAHMDPPTPWVTWAATLWNASLNQNLLHPATAPAAREIEAKVLAWLAPCFGMSGGHMTPGSTLANLTALWAARECAGVREVVASASAHLSVGKAAHILGLGFRQLPVDRSGALLRDALPADLSRVALVLTAGTTSTGAIDPLDATGRAAWTHVDAAWAGPLRLTRHAARLDGIERADSVAVSAHKWLFQPKESALVLFRDNAKASAAISFGGAYLAVPNVGVLGSHGASAVPLLATLLAWGRSGLAARIERCVELAGRFAQSVRDDARLELLAPPQTAIVAWRPRDTTAFERIRKALPPASTSTTTLGGEPWFRNVAANPNADVGLVTQAVRRALDAPETGR
jgi:L-2,4-diaminobutyrate decarboxylase